MIVLIVLCGVIISICMGLRQTLGLFLGVSDGGFLRLSIAGKKH